MRLSLFIPLAIIALTIGWVLSAFSGKQPTEINEIIEVSDEEAYVRDLKYIRVFDVTLKANTHYKRIDFDFHYTSFIIDILNNDGLRDARYKEDDGEITILNGAAHGEDDSRTMSSFVIPKGPQSTMDFYSGNLTGVVRFYLFYAPPLEIDLVKSLYKSADTCDRPAMIPGSSWRSGLSPPIGDREPTTTQHNIVHHAASSNNNHNYVDVVRNIYLLHTQSNGWDDIGYNFLVAQNGTVFEGRDPQGVADIDDIKGAHFCGKNSKTMGVCILGNYMETTPTDSALSSLHHLLVWKCVKSGIDPIAAFPHPEAGSASLPCIAGHRNGCATSCPGDSLYMKLASLRNAVYSTWVDCGGVAGIDNHMAKFDVRVSNADGKLILFPSDLDWKSIELYTTSGALIATYNHKDAIPTPAKGVYIMRILNGGFNSHSIRFAITE